MQIYIEDQEETFSNHETIINWIRSLIDKYAAAKHIQWIKGTLNGLHPKSLAENVNALILWFEDREARDKPYADLEKVKYT